MEQWNDARGKKRTVQSATQRIREDGMQHLQEKLAKMTLAEKMKEKKEWLRDRSKRNQKGTTATLVAQELRVVDEKKKEKRAEEREERKAKRAAAAQAAEDATDTDEIKRLKAETAIRVGLNDAHERRLYLSRMRGKGTSSDPYLINTRGEVAYWSRMMGYAVTTYQPTNRNIEGVIAPVGQAYLFTIVEDPAADTRKEVWWQYTEAFGESVETGSTWLKSTYKHFIDVDKLPEGKLPEIAACSYDRCLALLDDNKWKITCPCKLCAWCNPLCCYNDSKRHAHSCRMIDIDEKMVKVVQLGKKGAENVVATRLSYEKEKLDKEGLVLGPNGEWVNVRKLDPACTCGSCFYDDIAVIDQLWIAARVKADEKRKIELKELLAKQENIKKFDELLERKEKEASEDVLEKKRRAREQQPQTAEFEMKMKGKTVEERQAHFDAILRIEEEEDAKIAEEALKARADRVAEATKAAEAIIGRADLALTLVERAATPAMLESIMHR